MGKLVTQYTKLLSPKYETSTLDAANEIICDALQKIEHLVKTEELQPYKSAIHDTIATLKGERNLIRIECSCSSTAIWIARGNRKFDAKERRRFIEQHKDHKTQSFQARSTLS